MFYHFGELKVTLVVPRSRKKWFSLKFKWICDMMSIFYDS